MIIFESVYTIKAKLNNKRGFFLGGGGSHKLTMILLNMNHI